MGVSLTTKESWSGSALASIFKMRVKDALFGVFIGNAIAGAIILGVSLHLSEGSTEMIIASILLVLVGTIAYIYNRRKKKKPIVKKEALDF